MHRSARSSTDPIVFEFYTGGSEGTLVSGSATLSPEDIRLDSNIPAAPGQEDDTTHYVLEVTNSGGTDWQPADLTRLNDVNVAASPDNDQVLQYDSTAGEWINATLDVATTLNSLDDVVAPAPNSGNVLQWNGVRWINAALAAAQSWDDGFTASEIDNVEALRDATNPVFTDTDTTYNLNTIRDPDPDVDNVLIRLRDGITNDDVVSTVTLSPGTNISFGFVGETITINAPNFADSRVYATTALRNAADDVIWHRGDLAIVSDDNSYFYTGTDQTTAAATIDDDWEVLVTPTAQLDAMGVLNQLNMNDGTTDIRAELLPNIPDSLLSDNVLTNTSDITELRNVSYRPLLQTPINNSFLIWNSTDEVWTNSSSTVTDFQSVTVRNLETRLGEIDPGTIPLAMVNGAIDVAGSRAAISLPDTTPDPSGSGSLGYVESTGVLTYTPPDLSSVGGATVDDMAPTNPSEGDLWYYTGGDDEAGNEPGLFVYYDDGTTSNWTSTTSMYTVPAAPTGLTDDTSYNLQVTSGGEASWEPVADSGGGSSGGGGSAPTGSTFISSSATVFGSTNATIITLTADASSNSTFYVVGGTNKLHRTQDATANDAQARLFVGGIDHIVAGRGTVIFQNDTLHTYSGAFNIRDRTNMVWNDTEKYFIGRGSTLDQIPASNTRMGTGSGSPTGFAISGVDLHELQAYNGNSRQVNGGIIEAGGGFDFEVTVTAGQTAFFALTEPTNSNVSAEFYATRLN